MYWVFNRICLNKFEEKIFCIYMYSDVYSVYICVDCLNIKDLLFENNEKF